MTEEVIIPDPPPEVGAAELAVLRRQTAAFVSENATAVTITRSTRTPNGTGGWTTTTSDLQPQNFRFIQQGGNVASRNVDGAQVQPTYVLIGEWNRDIRSGDKFTFNGRTYEVMYVRGAGLPTSYETWAEVVYRG